MAFLDSTIGAVFATLVMVLAVSFVWNILQGYFKDMNAPNQVVMFKHPTDVVPADVVKRASDARRQSATGYFFFSFVTYAVIKQKYPESAESFEEGLKWLMMLFVDVVIKILDRLLQWLAE